MQEFDELRQLVDMLLDKGVGDYINLPQIAVMGDTSSGKSSLLSMISGVDFPATAELTTRCPTRLHMSHGDELYARISISWHSSSTYKVDEGSPNGFKEQHVTDFAAITTAIADAQKFIIERANADVTRDVIEVTVRSPDSTELTLIDLPGIVRTHGVDESASLGAEIMSLMDEYLKNPRCIILPVHPANVDFHNSQIMNDALKVDPDTIRTKPIITKPDRIDRGSERGVLDLLLGKKTRNYSLGFHIAMSRSQEALSRGDTVEKGLSDEDAYFRNTEPWNEVDADLKGVRALRTKLASIQVRMLESEVPQIKAEIAAKRSAAESKLKELGEHFPSLPEKRSAFSSITEFLRSVISHAESGHRADSSAIPSFVNEDGFTLRSNIEEIFTAFNKRMLVTKLYTFSDIRDGTPVVAVIAGNQYKGKVYKPMGEGQFAVDPTSQDNDHIFFDVCSGVVTTLGDCEAGKRIRLVYRDEGVHESVAGELAVLTRPGPGFREWEYKKYKPISASDLAADHTTWLLQQIVRKKSKDLCIFPSAEVFNSIVADAVAVDWKPIAIDLLETVTAMVEGCVCFAREASLADNQNVVKRVRAYLTDCLKNIIHDTLEDKCRSEILDCIDKEKQPSTQNHYLMENVRRERTAPLRRLIKSGATVEMVDNYLLSTETNQSNDEFVAGELQIALSAYGKVATKRFIDEVVKAINKALASLAPLVGKLPRNIKDADLERLMSEPSDTAEKRKRLEREIKAMQDADDAIKAL